jgi:hypothetical protein
MGNRREFLRRAIAGALGTTCAGPGKSWAVEAPGGGGQRYCFPVVGDLHFDRKERAYIESFEYARSWEFAMVRVDVDGVEADIYHGVEDAAPWRRVRLV